MMLSGSDILVKTLIEQGCDTVFGYPGGQILNVYDSLYTHQDKRMFRQQNVNMSQSCPLKRMSQRLQRTYA